MIGNPDYPLYPAPAFARGLLITGIKWSITHVV
jgi:hypothetical protein